MTAAPDPPSILIPPIRHRWPFTGRLQERAVVRTIVDDALRGGRTRGVVLQGPAGVGKTALAAAVAADAAEVGWATQRLVAGSADADVPLLWLAPLRPTGSTAQRHGELLGELASAIRDRSPERPLLVVLDDAPLLHDVDVDLVAHLLRSDLIVLVATARSGQSGIGAFNPMFVDDTLVRVEVAPLDHADLTGAAERFLGGPLHPESAALLRRASSGLPLFARELVVANLVHGSLVDTEEGWRFTGGVVAPPTLLELLADRCRGLSVPQLRHLETLAVAQPLPIGVEPDDLDMADLAALEDLGLVTADVESGSTVVRLAHPLYAEALLAQAGPLRRREIAERASAALADLPLDDPDRELRLATLCTEHGIDVADDVLVRAAHRALHVLDPGLAERLVDRVTVATWDSLFVLGTARTLLGRIDEADRTLADAQGLATDDEALARTASRRANCLGTSGGRFTDSLRVIDEAIAAVTDERWRAFLEADRAYTLLAIGDRPDVPLESSATGAARANECFVGAAVASLSGRCDDALSLVDEGLSLVHHLVSGIPTARELLHLSRFIAFSASGRAADAAAIVTDELVRAGGRPELSGTWWAMEAVQLLLDGRTIEAEATARRAVAALEVVDISQLRPFVIGLRAVALAQLGRTRDAEEVLGAIEPIWRDETKTRLMAEQARAWILVRNRRTLDAATRLARAATDATNAQHATLGLFAVHDVVRIGHPSVAIPVLRLLEEQCQGRLVSVLHDHARALDRGDPTALVSYAEELPELGFTLSAAEAASTAGRLLERAGRTKSAVEARTLAGRLVERLGAVDSPALGAVTTLTAREREIAELASQRLRSREIAERLQISVRTVDNHLVAVYRKLGVASRTELEHLLTDR